MTVTAHLTPTDIPGLVDVRVSDGREFLDLTMGQLQSLSAQEGWKLDPPPPPRTERAINGLAAIISPDRHLHTIRGDDFEADHD